MVFLIDTRPADSPQVEQIWRARSLNPGTFISVASNHWEMVVTYRDASPCSITVRGPETHPTHLTYAMGGEWFGIRFRLGTLLPCLPVCTLVDRAVSLPVDGSDTFQLHGAAWTCPDFDTADAFINRLVRTGVLAGDPLVAALLRGDAGDIATRSAQRRFQQATGMSQRTVRQISRARQAMRLLQQGASILDAVHEAGYYDQAHLSRSMKRWLGHTPSQLKAENAYLGVA